MKETVILFSTNSICVFYIYVSICKSNYHTQSVSSITIQMIISEPLYINKCSSIAINVAFELVLIVYHKQFYKIYTVKGLNIKIKAYKIGWFKLYYLHSNYNVAQVRDQWWAMWSQIWTLKFLDGNFWNS